MIEKKTRIWELDALRGICILGMIFVHFFFDLSAFGGMKLTLPKWFLFMREYGHILFILISGICATLAKTTAKRGAVVFAAGLLVSYVTFFMEYVIGISGIRIWFGILHLLGMCMLLYPLFRRLPFWALGLIGMAFIALGIWMDSYRVSVDFLFPIGLRSGNCFTGSDFFPLFPGLGWFLVGACIGKTAYRRKQSLLPRAPSDFCILRFFRFCGRHSLEIYLLHQPVLTIAVTLHFD